MKTKNLYYAFALCAGTMAVALPASAQDVFVDDAVSVTEFTCDNSTHYFSNWKDNWFIQLEAGVNQPFFERGDYKTPGNNVSKKKMTLTYGAGVGRWVSPYFGFRLRGQGGVLHWNTPMFGHESTGWTKAKHANLQAEVMWDMFNSLGGVNSKRVFSIIPYVGLGGDAMWGYADANGNVPAATSIITKNGTPKKIQWTLPVSAGVQFRVRLNDYVDFFAEARAAFYGDNWDNFAQGESIESNVSAVGGFNINIGPRQFGEFNQCTYVSQIAALNGQVNDLRAQLLAAGAEVASLAAQLPCPEVKAAPAPAQVTPLMATVRFSLNSDKIAPEEQVNIYNMAQWLKANPTQKVVVAGYADKDTGTAEYNLGLSERRAEAVVNALVKDYGISSDRLQVKYDGSAVQPYGENDWNRIVIFSQK